MTHPTFELVRQQPIDSLGVNVAEYHHTETAAHHIHIQADNSENAFLVALRTVPHDSTGVAHILEHTALCGSRRYPVRDPFFMMIRRSLNTFMNAFTSSDWTAYPFASVNRKDFDNLMDVYLDAVFFPTLHPLDFAQEGHRLEFKESENPDSGLEFKGVVFNEMKGAMSSDNSVLWQTLTKYLFPTTTYHFNSGGDPEAIPDLSYEELVEFHRSHYHPSNAIFMTFGDIPAEQHQSVFEQRVLSEFDRLDEKISVPREKRYLSPIRVEEAYAVDASETTEDKAHVVVGWLLGESADLYESMKANLLSSVLFDNSASPLQKALETCDLGKAPSPMCGLEDSQREMIFAAGLEGCKIEDVEKIESLVMGVIHDVAENGVDLEQVKACLHQIELSQREITGDGFPYGLNLILTALNSATHRGDPIALLNLEPVLARLHEEIGDRDFVSGLCRDLLLENPHRVRLTLRPDIELDQRRQQAESNALAEIVRTLDEKKKQQVVDQTIALQQRQNQEDDPEILPKVTLDDVQSEMNYCAADSVVEGGKPLTRYTSGTNGLVYQQIVAELPYLTSEELELLPLLSQLMTEVGVGERNYLETQQWQASVCGSIHASYRIRGNVDDPSKTRGYFSIAAKALQRNQGAICELMNQTFACAHFDETQRLQEIVSQSRMSAQNSITGNGHALAMKAAAQNFSPVAQLGHKASGLAGIAHLIQLDDELKSSQALADLSKRLSDLHGKINSMPSELLLIAEAEQIERNTTEWLSTLESSETKPVGQSLSLAATSMLPANQLWATRSQVNFCSMAFPTVPMNHPDAPVLTALGGYLRNNFLHRSIREQGGAYGGGASQENDQAAFRFYSYRDPRLEETLNDFNKSIDWILNTPPEASLVEESILGVIANIDKPASPAGEARQAFHAELHGRTREIREQFRNRTLNITGEDLQRVAGKYLAPERASTAVITDSSRSEIASDLNLSVELLTS